VIANARYVDRSHIRGTINLTTLAPDIQAAIPHEILPDTLSLFDRTSDTPLSWKAQTGWVERQGHDGRLQLA